MKALKIAMLLPGLLLVAGVLWAATQYGEAVIEQGSMTVLREGQTLTFDQPNRAVPVNEGDLIRVRADSVVQLKSRENATITLGSNAVFQVKPWRAQGKTGFLRALFGRFRANVAALSGGEQFNVRTATATIGVKGTGYFGQTLNRGASLVGVTENNVGVQGQSGPEQGVGQGFATLVLGTNPATSPIPIPQDLLDAFQNLNSPAANSPAARRFAAQQALIDAGIVDQNTLDQSSGDDSGDTSGDTGGDSDGTELTLPDLEQISGPRARVRLDFQP